jgi:hypothetical protein
MLFEYADRLRHEPLESLRACFVDGGLAWPAAEASGTSTRILQLTWTQARHSQTLRVLSDHIAKNSKFSTELVAAQTPVVRPACASGGEGKLVARCEETGSTQEAD